ncbi:hypothetical protein R1flu_007124 [Riccia fluitans]|uniref:Uncharacterized protein n=1 Tax=Riccia fluitans TaxID=41844 RepID=A0ABD1YXY6_9MARC
MRNAVKNRHSTLCKNKDRDWRRTKLQIKERLFENSQESNNPVQMDLTADAINHGTEQVGEASHMQNSSDLNLTRKWWNTVLSQNHAHRSHASREIEYNPSIQQT